MFFILTGGYRHDRIKRGDEQRETRAKHWSDSICGVFSGDRGTGKWVWRWTKRPACTTTAQGI